MRNLWSPESFQGKRRKHHYFEGWYFKHSGGRAAGVWSLIPGVATGDGTEAGYSFIQVIEGRTGRSWWFQFPLESFAAAESGLDIRIGDNHFSRQGIRFDLDDGQSRISGEFSYGPFSEFRFPFWSPGVMGPFTFVPGMECNHGLVSLHHRVKGWISADGTRVDIGEGRGYIEKDWGRSMPESWIWMQSNDFPREGDSFMLSVAKIPWMGSSFNGFLCAASLGEKKLLFTTYNGSRMENLEVDDTEVSGTISRRKGKPGEARVEIRAERTRGGILRAPVAGLLSRRISEAVDSRLHIRYLEDGTLRYAPDSALAGLEVAGGITLPGRA